MSKLWTPRKKTVELQTEVCPSRIRREPPPPQAVQKAANPYPTEREVWTVVIGVVAFAVAITIIIFGFSDFTSK